MQADILIPPMDSRASEANTNSSLQVTAVKENTILKPIKSIYIENVCVCSESGTSKLYFPYSSDMPVDVAEGRC